MTVRAPGRGAGAEPAAAQPPAPPDLPRPRPPVALYVHIPFCLSVCPYCDFVVYAGADARGPRARVERFLDAVAAELALRADDLDARFGRPGVRRPPLRTVYLGGGTPSLLPAPAIARLVEQIRDRFGVADGAEITLEANPGPGERGDARAWAALGVTRLSIGAQSLDAAELRRLGRRHTPGDVAAAMADARSAGIPSVSLDLLYDLPGSTIESWRVTLDAALALEPDHLSLYALTLDDPDAEGLAGETGDHLAVRPGARRWREAARRGQDQDVAADQYALAVDRLDAADYRAYEISNWSRPGHESRHNLAYWRRQTYEAVGPGAHAFDGLVRRHNAARLDAYLDALTPADGRAARLPPGGEETIGCDAALSERVVLGLRTDRGVPAALARRAPLAPHIPWGIDAGLLQWQSGDRLVLTTRGRLLSNELFSRLV